MRWLLVAICCYVVCSVSSAPAESDEPYLKINTLKNTFNVGEKKAIYCEGQHITGDLEWYDPSGAKIPPRSTKAKRIYVEPRGATTDGPTFLPLMIQNLILADSGTYICKAGDLSGNITIFVGEKVVIKESEEDLVEEEGHHIDLSCQAKGTPVPDVQWYDKDSQPIVNNAKYRITYKPRSSTSVLRINDLSHMDPGTYKCKATQEKISHFAEKFFHLSVRHKPVIINEYSESEVYAILDEWKNITCKAIAYPAPTFTWSKHDDNYDEEMRSDGTDHKITTSKETEGNSVLTLHITNDTLEKQYKCTVENPKGRQNFMFHVSLGNKPDPPTAVVMSSATANNITFEVSCENCTFYKDDGIAPKPENLPVLGYVFEIVPHMEGFAVPYWLNGTQYTFDITSDNETTFTIGNLEKTTEYHVRVATRNIAGQSDWFDVEGFPKTTDGAATLTKSIGLLIFALYFSLRY
ncbi:neural cell adhesion molecule 2-like [Cydia fagiglandana]|uniref:neural cell adhesion molecule 2-like n=1 Tax=Cydia fagiglandana TaxID=1458189 RepID=UPI002FEE509A